MDKRSGVNIAINELELAINAGRKVRLSCRDDRGQIIDGVVKPRSIASYDHGDYLIFEHGGETGTVRIDAITDFDLL